MTEQKHEALRRLFDLARGAAPGDRGPLLDRECGGDAELKSRIEAMVAAAEDDRFLSDPTQDHRDSAPADDAAAAALIAAPLCEGPGMRIGPYKLLQIIGEGGFGWVFMAEQETPVQRKVALKIIKLGMDTRQVVARFEQERQALAMMDHPNIARVLDAGATRMGRPYFVMELVKGAPIVEYCDKNNLSIRERLELFSQVCNAVQHAHTKGIIHRDIKPSNVLVSTQDGRPHTKVIDFGIAKATASKLTEKTLFTEHRQLIGTPEYMSPEQAEGSLDIDTRTDVYSLGVLLYELLTGTTPFGGNRLRSAAYAEIQRIIREVEPPKPSTRLSDNTDTIASIAAKRHTEPRRLGAIVRGELDWIVMKSLEKDRNRRYESAAALSSDVLRHLADEPVSAGPPGAAYRVRKFMRRHRGKVGVACVLAAAIAFGIVGTSVGLWQAYEQNKVVSAQRDTASAALARVAKEARSKAGADGNSDAAFGNDSLTGHEPVQALADVTVGLIGRIDLLRRAETEQRAAAEVSATEARASAARAERDRQKAEAARARADQIAGFLKEVLASADPTARGAQVTLVSVLRSSDALFDARLQDQPEVELELRETIGQTLANLGAYRDALPHQKRAMILAARIAPPANDAGQDPRLDWLKRWMQPLFRSCLALGEADQVVSIANAAASDVAAERGEDAPVVTLLRTGAAALGPAIATAKGTLKNPADQPSARRTSSRADLARERLTEARNRHGDADLRTIDAMFDLAAALSAPAEAIEAESLYSAARAAEAPLRAADDPVLQRHQFQHAIFTASRREPAEAIALLQSAIEESERVAGAGRVEVIEALRALAGHQARVPDPDGQLKTLRSAMSIAHMRFGAAHPTSVLVCLELLPALARVGEFAEAERLLRECSAAIEQGVGAESPLLGSVKGGLAHVFAAQGRHQEAVDVLRPVIAAMNNASGLGAVQSFDPRSRLVDSLIELGQWKDAEVELQWFAADPKDVSKLPGSIRRHGARLWARLFERRAVAQPGEGYEAQAERWRALAKAPQPTGDQP